jgi:hypothetical protein
VDVTNTGGQKGTDSIKLYLNGILVESRQINLLPGQTEKVVFYVAGNEIGDYKVEIGNLAGEFQTSTMINWLLLVGSAGLLLLLFWLAWRFLLKGMRD